MRTHRRARVLARTAVRAPQSLAHHTWRQSSRLWRAARTFVRDYTALSVVIVAAGIVAVLNMRVYATSDSLVGRLLGGGQAFSTAPQSDAVPVENLAMAPLPIAPPRAVTVQEEVQSLEEVMMAQGDLTGRGDAAIAGDGGDITIYTVKEGDTISEIARTHGVTVDTILWANEIDDVARIKPGDTIIILATNGVRHKVAQGDTVESIAKKYKADAKAIISYNGLPANGELTVGEEIIVPDGIKEEVVDVRPRIQRRTYASISVAKKVAVSRGYYRAPLNRYRRTQGLHRTNAVDMAAPTGTPVYAAAAGRVIIARHGWNGGYGRYIVIQHPNGTKTLYAHNSRLLVKVGQKVKKGQQIAKVGSTGRSTGPHVHFEIRGARNPF